MKYRSAIIVGGGPAGSATATLLARAGITVVLFDAGVRPELIVGESLVPACIPVLRNLGVEQEVREYSTVKPGASFIFRGTEETVTHFVDFPRALATYAYNVPRDRFDQTLLDNARRAGAHIVKHRASFQRLAERSIALDPASAELCRKYLDPQSSFLIDASGRRRLTAALLGIGERVGNRKDTALFAHMRPLAHTPAGYVLIDRLKVGWSWRIPLPGKISVGVVVAPEALKQYGVSAELQFDRMLRTEEVLSRYTAGAERISPVARYSNYQLISNEFVGDGWAMVGDSAGFVDPIFSSGLSLALEGAEMLSEAVISGASATSLQRYQKTLSNKLTAWQEVANSFYDGRLAGLVRACRLTADIFPWGWMLPKLEPRFKQVFTGLVSPLSLNFRLTRLALRYGPGARFGSRLQIR